MEHRNIKTVAFKVPRGIRSKKNECSCNVEFKNLTDDYLILYWVDFHGRPKLYGELSPINRTDRGLCLETFVTHPWIAVKGRLQALMNGKRYFYPSNPAVWQSQRNGWMNPKWNNIEDDGTPDTVERRMEGVDKYFEVLIEKPGVKSLKDIALARCCELFSSPKSIEMLPKSLKLEMEVCRRKFFWW